MCRDDGEKLTGCQRSLGAVIVYGVATIGRLLKNIGLFCKRALQRRPIFYRRDLYFYGAY